MRVQIVLVGRGRRDAFTELADDYARRCPFDLRFVEVPARPEREARTAALAREAEAVREVVPAAAVLIALDAGGEDLGSEAFAKRLGAWRDAGRRDIACVMGGARGLDPGLIAAADLVLAFGRATWPHRLVRVMLAEQLYRAATILRGHPYHRSG